MATLNNSSLTDILDQINEEMARNLLPLVVTCGVFMAVGLVGNGLVMYIYWRKMKSSAKRTFIMALAMMDFCACLFVIPFEIYDLENQVLFTSGIICKAMRVLEYVAIVSAGFVLVSVSFERYYFLCKAFQEFTPRKARYVCFACVAFAGILAVPAAVFAGSKSRTVTIGNISITGCECSLNNDDTNAKDMLKRYYYYLLALVFFGCFMVFVIIYSLIGRLLWKYQRGTLVHEVGRISIDSNATSSVTRTKKISFESNSGGSGCPGTTFCSYKVHGRRKNVRSARSIVIFFSVTVVFILSFLPHITVRILKFLDYKLDPSVDELTRELLYNFLVRSYLISNVTNPFIYSILNSAFRKELHKTFRNLNICRWHKRRSLSIEGYRK